MSKVLFYSRLTAIPHIFNLASFSTRDSVSGHLIADSRNTYYLKRVNMKIEIELNNKSTINYISIDWWGWYGNCILKRLLVSWEWVIQIFAIISHLSSAHQSTGCFFAFYLLIHEQLLIDPDFCSPMQTLVNVEWDLPPCPTALVVTHDIWHVRSLANSEIFWDSRGHLEKYLHISTLVYRGEEGAQRGLFAVPLAVLLTGRTNGSVKRRSGGEQENWYCAKFACTE